MKKISLKKLFFIFIIPALILLDISICTLLYFFEPIYYNAPDLSLSDFSFDLYEKYNDKNSDFYIKQIDGDDIVVAENDIRLKYVNNTILISYSKELANIDIITDIISAYNGNVCGYIEEAGFVQAEFIGCDYPALLEICFELEKYRYIHSALVDYFEETPVSEAVTITTEDDLQYYYKLINYPADLSAYNIDASSVSVGIFDVLLDNNNTELNIINNDEYSSDFLNNELISSFNSHGTHVAGICAGSVCSNAPSICPDAQIVSENAMNCSISYWVAAICDMIINQNVNVINMSIGYNADISLSASLGCSNAIEFIDNESEFFSEILQNIIDDGYEFVICTAAGNYSHRTVNVIHNGYFSFGEKRILDKLDIFNIFTRNAEYAAAEYSLPFNSEFYNDMKSNVIVVGSCDKYGNLSHFTSLSDRIDIVAPGEQIYSFGSNNNYEYMSGTSMATPFVSGTAALLFAANPHMTGEAAKNIIVSSATQTVAEDNFTFPLLNVTNALEMIK